MSLFFDYHWSAGAAFRRAREILRTEEGHSLWCRILDGTISRRTMLIERSLNDPVADIPTRPDVVVEILKPSDIEAYLQFRAGADPSRVRRRIAEGHWCFAARHDRRLIGVFWATTDPQRLLPVAWTPPLRPGELYLYDLFVTPEARGSKVASTLTSTMLQYFQAAGYRRVVAAILLRERGLMRLYQRLGFDVYGRMTCLKIGPWRRLFYHELVISD